MEKRKLLYCWWDCNSVQPLEKQYGGSPQKGNPEIPLWGLHPKGMKTLTPKDICTPMFIPTLFMKAKTWKQSTVCQ